MNNNMKEIDKLIKETLSKEEAKFYEDLEEQNVLQMLTGLFHGKNKWLMYVMNFMTLIFFALFVYCLVMFFSTDQTNDLIKWGIGGLMFLMALSMLKLFAWLQMDKNTLLRELKRLELQLLSVTGRISE